MLLSGFIPTENNVLLRWGVIPTGNNVLLGGIVSMLRASTSKFKMAICRSVDADEIVEVPDEVNCSTQTERFSKPLKFNVGRGSYCICYN